MERVVYRQMAELDQRHWWYRARREVLADLIRREAMPPPDAHILEIGCGTGHNLEMLAGFARSMRSSSTKRPARLPRSASGDRS